MSGNQPDHFSGLRMPAERLLGKHDRVIHGHFKHTAARGSQPNLRLWPTIPQRGRQTDGPGLVVSDGAEFDRKAHEEERGAKSEREERRARSEQRGRSEGTRVKGGARLGWRQLLPLPGLEPSALALDPSLLPFALRSSPTSYMARRSRSPSGRWRCPAWRLPPSASPPAR